MPPAPHTRTMNTGLRSLFERWLDHRLGTAARSTQLHYRRIFILPSRGGLLFGVMLFAMWLGALNYSSSLAYMLCFLLSGFGCVAMVHTFRNLVGLKLRLEAAEPVFSGGQARFPLHIRNDAGRSRYGLEFRYPGMSPITMDIGGNGDMIQMLSVPAPHRGRLRPQRFRILTRFPGGLFTAWSWLRFHSHSVVYPAPESGPVPAPPGGRGIEHGQNITDGDEDFHGLRRYQPGDSLRHVAWRTLARGQELQTKQFANYGRSLLWLDWESLPQLPTEARLSRLTRWVIDLDAQQRPYGLRLPDKIIPPGCGHIHQRTCLTALALMPGAAEGQRR